MNMFNIIMQHTIKISSSMLTNVSFTFAPPITPLIYVPGHDLNSNASLNLDASLSLIPTMDVHGIANLHVL